MSDNFHLDEIFESDAKKIDRLQLALDALTAYVFRLNDSSEELMLRRAPARASSEHRRSQFS